MEITIENWKGCRSATITAQGVTLLAGRNGAGKSSALEAIASAATGRKLSTAEKQRKVSRGQARASVVITDGPSVRELSLPSGELSLVQWESSTSPYAAGAIDATALSSKDLTALMLSILDARPTEDDLRKALAPYGYDPKEQENVCAHIRKHGDKGYDAAHETFADQGKKLKGQYRECTGQTYGVAQSASWIPDGWEADLTTFSEETLQAALADENSRLEALIKEQAVDDSNYAALQEKWLGIDKAMEAVAKATEDREVAKQREKAAQDEYDSARLAYQKIPVIAKGVKPDTFKCFNCGQENLAGGGKPPDAKGPSEKEIAENLKTRQAAEAAGKAAKNQLDIMQAQALSAILAVNNAEKEVAACQAAHEELLAAKPADAKGATTEEIEAQRGAVAHAERRIRLFQQYQRSRVLYNSVVKNQYLIDILAPEGLRKQKLSAAVKQFNLEHLKPVCDLAQWTDEAGERQELVIFPNDMTMAFGPTALEECSEGEKVKARITMQVALAYIDDSDMILIDRIDELDSVGRHQLFTLAASLDDKPVIVALHYRDREAAPNIAKIGRTYWIENQTVTPLAEAAAVS